MVYLESVFIKFAITLQFVGDTFVYYVNDRRINKHFVTNARVTADGRLELYINECWRVFNVTTDCIVNSDYEFKLHRRQFTPISTANSQIVAPSLSKCDVFLWYDDRRLEIHQKTAQHMVAIVNNGEENRLQLLVSTRHGVIEHPFESCEYIDVVTFYGDNSEQLEGYKYIATAKLYDFGYGVLRNVMFNEHIVTSHSVDNRRLFNLQISYMHEPAVNCYVHPDRRVVVFEKGGYINLKDLT